MSTSPPASKTDPDAGKVLGTGRMSHRGHGFYPSLLVLLGLPRPQPHPAAGPDTPWNRGRSTRPFLGRSPGTGGIGLPGPALG
ncbi:hypothetical protein DMR_01250 [Solidesulfovibrio magneticus RS-1]|uniref:Uncharacterized protein n=1 Tax=Solidesulfovibrio magneticus (strain ATCC 700980 / DSM 13731 / RS-1) TaxID=573370 RepID=C4XTV1_SOLM1|nr:hypothetical protein DMR_01250 [Solidesulfovibrio magneticus RS-1]